MLKIDNGMRKVVAGCEPSCQAIFRLEILQYLMIKGLKNQQSYEGLIVYGYLDQVQERLVPNQLKF
jgi:hypothetical protein